MYHTNINILQVRPEFYLAGGNFEAIHNLCLMLKNMLRKSCQNLRADI